MLFSARSSDSTRLNHLAAETEEKCGSSHAYLVDDEDGGG